MPVCRTAASAGCLPLVTALLPAAAPAELDALVASVRKK
jgi:hypothetical protein